MGWDGPTTLRQYRAYCEWAVIDLNQPDKTELYLMQLTADFRSYATRKPVAVSSCQMTGFGSAPPQPAAAPTPPKPTPELPADYAGPRPPKPLTKDDITAINKQRSIIGTVGIKQAAALVKRSRK